MLAWPDPLRTDWAGRPQIQSGRILIILLLGQKVILAGHMHVMDAKSRQRLIYEKKGRSSLLFMSMIFMMQ